MLQMIKRKLIIDDISTNHFIYLSTFLLGNILVQIIYFILIKFLILDKIESLVNNLESLQTTLNCK